MKYIRMPKLSRSNYLDRVGSAIFEATYADSMVLIPHIGNKDFGIDYTIELIDKTNREILGHYVAVQLKTHKNIVFNKNGYYSQQVKITTANYWLTLNMPILLVLLDIENNIRYYVDTQKYLRENYNFKKFAKQKYIKIKVMQKDVFDFKSCLLASIEYDKYKILRYSANDCLIIRNLFVDMNETLIKDWFLPVESYEDMTVDAINLAEKYNHPFIINNDLASLYNNMMEQVKDCYFSDGKIDYDKYIEQTKSNFNKAAIDYYVKLVFLICDEIENDKTEVLRKKLYKFIRLKKEIEKNGKPGHSRYWADAKNYNDLNNDYETIDNGKTWIQ